MKLACHALACGIVWSLAAGDLGAAEPKLEIRNFHLIYGQFGPERPDAAYFPGERMGCRYDLFGCAADEQGRSEVEVTIQLIDAKGKVRVAFSNVVKSQSWKNSKGFARVWSFHQFADDVRPGKYQFELAVEDKSSQREAKLAQEVVVKPIALAIVSPRFYHDARHEVPGPLSGLVDQTIHASFDVVGEDRSQGKVLLVHSFEILDDEGENILLDAKPQEAQLDDPQFLQDRSRRPVIRVAFPLRKAGRYTLRLTILDQMAGAKTQLELPLEVLDPSELSTVAVNN